jgi:hypothetical protein
MDWAVELTSQAKKQAEKLPKRIVAALIQPMMDIKNQDLSVVTGRTTVNYQRKGITAT